MDNNNMKYITVLDFEVGHVYQYELNYKVEIKDYEAYLTGKGHNINNCEWMVHSDNEIITK